MQEGHASGTRSGIATYIVDVIVALLMLIGGIVVIIESRRLGAGWTSDGPGSGYFPFLIGVILSVASLGVLYESLISKKNTEIFVDGEQFKRVLSVLVPAVLYVLAITFLGIYVASAIYITLFMVVLGKYSWIKSLAVALSVNTLFFFMFEVWFKVPLYKGTLDVLSFLGY